MRAFEIQGEFGLDHLELVERASAPLGRSDVRIALRAASLNYRDQLMVAGMYNPKQPLPLIPLSDGVGKIVEAGADVSRVQVGDRVMGAFCQAWLAGPVPGDRAVLKQTLGGPIDGMLATEIVLPAEGVVRVPSELTDLDAATLPCAGLTAWSALVTQGTARPGDTVVVQGTGGVSVFALQFAKMLGLRVIVTSSSDEKLARARVLGADEVINYQQTPKWSAVVRELTDGRGADQIVEVGGTGTLEQSLRSIRPGGLVSVIGVLAGGVGQINLFPVLMQNVRLQGVIVGSRAGLERMCRAISTNRMRPVVDRVFPFAEAREAFRYLGAQKHFGKVAIDLTA